MNVSLQFPKLNFIHLVVDIIEIGSIWEGKTYLRNAASLVIRECDHHNWNTVNLRGQNLSKKCCQSRNQRVWWRQIWKKFCWLACHAPCTGGPGSSSKFNSPQLCSPLPYRNIQYLLKNFQSPPSTYFLIKTMAAIFWVGFTLSKWPHLNSIYLLGVWYSFSEPVSYFVT